MAAFSIRRPESQFFLTAFKDKGCFKEPLLCAPRQGQIANCKFKTLLGHFVCQQFEASSLAVALQRHTIQARTIRIPENTDQNHDTGHVRANGSVNTLPLLPLRHNYFAKIPVIQDSAVSITSLQMAPTRGQLEAYAAASARSQ